MITGLMATSVLGSFVQQAWMELYWGDAGLPKTKNMGSFFFVGAWGADLVGLSWGWAWMWA